MITFLSTLLGASCIGMGPSDVHAISRLVRTQYHVADSVQAHVVADSPECRRIAAASGYEARVSVLEFGPYYVVVEWDEFVVLDKRLRRVKPGDHR